MPEHDPIDALTPPGGVVVPGPWTPDVPAQGAPLYVADAQGVSDWAAVAAVAGRYRDTAPPDASTPSADDSSPEAADTSTVTAPAVAAGTRPAAVPRGVVLEGVVLPSRGVEVRPVVPGWMRSASSRRAVAGWWLGVQWYKVRFHAFRAPVYVGRVAWRTPKGAFRLVSRLLVWALDIRADGMEQALSTGGRTDAADFVRVREDRAARVKARLVVLALGLIATAVAATIVVTTFGVLARTLIGAGVVAGLTWLGSDPGRPLVAGVMAASGKYRELTDAIVMRALRAAGLGGAPPRLDKDGHELSEDTRPTLAAPISRSANGRGYEVVVDLPYGKTAGDAADAVDKLASGLDVDTAQVFPEPVAGRSRRVSLYVADEDPMTLPPTRSPLARLPKVSVWDPQPMARTPVGHAVTPSLLFNSFLVGAVPRAGKSFAAKVLVAPGVLDPFCDLTAIDCKGGRDWLPTAQVAVDFSAGDEEEDLLRALSILERRRSEARERLASFRTLTAKEMPEDKLTRELADAGMRAHLIVVDELQNLLKATNRDIRKAALDVLVWLAKTAPAAGYTLVAITQRPAADVIPADFRDVTTVRIALRTKTRQGSDAILGADISATGYRTDRFMEHHKGAAIIGGVPTPRGGDLQVVRTDLLTPAEFDQACKIGRQRRLDAGTLIGAAAGEDRPIEVTVTVLEDVAAVWPGDDPKAQAASILARLQDIYPARYTGMDEGSLTKALKPDGITPVQVNKGGRNRNGYALADIRRALRARRTDDDDTD
ncbi:hypothetical protein [Pseudofrankia sp. DC12]|uniref:hypothetical protein n=1 Tax=Pseudofrankia sp. DC12 TaxID=683315 RepID=UPI0005F7E3E5|nr:hypothetical protein [Pseudofrankia sp. DC12]